MFGEGGQIKNPFQAAFGKVTDALGTAFGRPSLINAQTQPNSPAIGGMSAAPRQGAKSLLGE